MALGADARRLRAMVLGQVGRMTLAGGAIGFVLGPRSRTRAAVGCSYEMDRLPPGVIAGAVAAMPPWPSRGSAITCLAFSGGVR